MIDDTASDRQLLIGLSGACVLLVVATIGFWALM